MKITFKHTCRSFSELTLWVFLLCFTGLFSVHAQDQMQIRNAVDSTSVQFGRVINYAIQVEGNKGKNVVFPEGDSFSPLEVLESFKIDTLDEAGKYRLLKQYALTQFDTGHYTIPKQKVIIADKTFFTDSINIEIRDVVVDTSKVKLYDVKGLLSVEDISETDWKSIIIWGIGIALLIGLIIFTIWKFNIGIKETEEDLPSYERAMLDLSRVNKGLLDENKYKAYYSQLTDIAKKYLDEEVDDNALESTTDELESILFSKLKKGDIRLNKDEIKAFINTLKTADLSKFAAINPSKGEAENDQKTITSFLRSVKSGLPELTEEQLMQNEAYRQEKERKQKLQRQKVMLIASIIALLLSGLVYYVAQSSHKIKDFVLNTSGASLLHKDWITSTYGVPGMSVSTPGLLTRNPIKLNEQDQQLLSGSQIYVFGTLDTKFNIVLNTLTFRQDVGFTAEKGVETVFKRIEEMGGKNIVVKNEEYSTVSGTEGVKVYGSFEYLIPNTTIGLKYSYTILIFAENQGMQQIMVFHEEGDKDAKEVADRVLNSVEIKKSEN